MTDKIFPASQNFILRRKWRNLQASVKNYTHKQQSNTRRLIKPSKACARSIQRMMVSHHVPSWPDVPARFESLNNDTLGLILKFVGDKSYKSFGGLSKQCREVYIASGMEKKTFLFGYESLSVISDRIERTSPFYFVNMKLFESVGKGVVLYNRRDVLEWAVQIQHPSVVRGICDIAGGEGRLNILNEVWNNVEDWDDKRHIFREVDRKAAQGGKMNVLKWLETKGFTIYKMACAGKAAWGGQLHILQWLQEEQGLELDEVLYSCAIDGNQLHVMKWLREREVDWPLGDFTFTLAAQKGNLDILQWLHDEGCPWPDYNGYRVSETDVKSEALAWLHANGYSDRISINSD